MSKFFPGQALSCYELSTSPCYILINVSTQKPTIKYITGDRDRGVRDGSDDGLNSDGKLIDKDDAFDLVVIADLFLGRPGGL